MHKITLALTCTLVTCTLALAGSLALAEIYKEIDKDGNIVYTDVPRKGKQKPVTVKPMTTYKSKPARRTTGSESKSKTAASKSVTTYNSLQVSSPAADAVIRANDGVVSIRLQSQPSLDSGAGHRIVILIDGQQRQTGTSGSATVNNVDRGTHTIGGEIRDKNGTVLISANPVTVHVQRASVLIPRNR